jgi:hypothetical protein
VKFSDLPFSTPFHRHGRVRAGHGLWHRLFDIPGGANQRPTKPGQTAESTAWDDYLNSYGDPAADRITAPDVAIPELDPAPILTPEGERDPDSLVNTGPIPSPVVPVADPYGQVVIWDSGGDGYSGTDPLNWNIDVVPGSADQVFIFAPISVDFLGSSFTFHSLWTALTNICRMVLLILTDIPWSYWLGSRRRLNYGAVNLKKG